MAPADRLADVDDLVALALGTAESQMADRAVCQIFRAAQLALTGFGHLRISAARWAMRLPADLQVNGGHERPGQ